MDRKLLFSRRLFGVTLLCIAALGGSVFAQKGASGGFVRDELLIKFNDGAVSSRAEAANRSIGAAVLEKFANLSLQRVRIPAGKSLDEAIEYYKSLENVDYVQKNYYYQLLATPNDPQFISGNMYGLSKISAPLAWDLTTGSSTVVVADIDTGLRYTHEDLAANAWVNPGEIVGNGVDDDANGFVDDVYGADFFFNDGDPADENGHGTHTAGTIGAVGNNMLGVSGVNWNVKIMAIKIYDSDGFGTTSAMLVNAYNYVRMMKNRGVNVRVTNNSYGGCDEACGYDQATKDALDAMGDAGILSVFAAGNQASNVDTTPYFPVAYTSPSVLGVASSTSTDARSGFSNFGPVAIDLAAPGSGILSTTFSSNSSYGILSGTSMATPHAAGAAALLSAHNPALSPASLKATLMNTVDPIAEWAGVVKSGGRLNVDRALRNQTVCTFSPSATAITAPTKGGVFSINVTAGQNCDYAVRSNAGWIKVLSSEAMTGNGALTFRVTVNPAIRRTATISVGGHAIMVTQSRIG